MIVKLIKFCAISAGAKGQKTLLPDQKFNQFNAFRA